MKKILLITTGGTIASGNSNGGGLAPEKHGAEMLTGTERINTDVLDLFAIDSTDITPAHWRLLYSTVTENLPLYDGIVILHGTDTMAYTGAVLAFTVNTDKPVILTGSMLPFGAEDSDARDNIMLALQTASRGTYRGVFLAFAGRIIGGADIVKVNSTEKDAFRSYAGFEPARTYKFPEHSGIFPAVVKLTPFSDGADIKRLAGNKSGIVIETYGAGGLPAGEITLAAGELAKTIPVVITTPCLGGSDLGRYEVGRRALDAGASDAGKRSAECAAVEMWLKQNQ